MKKAIILFRFLAVVFSFLLGYSTIVNASVTDTSFAFYNINGSMDIPLQKQYTYCDPYIGLTSGPSLLCTIQGYSGGSWCDRSETVCLTAGTWVRITNDARLYGDTMVRLHMERTTFGYVFSYGTYSLEAPGDYIIYS